MAKLYYVFSTMNAGKSAQLLMKAHSFLENNIPILCIKPSIDDRDGQGVIKSRIGLEMECLTIDSDDDIEKFIIQYCANMNGYGLPCPQWILCDESQFLTSEQVDQLSVIVDNYDINVMCYGLRNDFTGHLFPGSKRLFELADNIEEMKLSCACGRKAIINARINEYGDIVTDGEQIKVGGNNMYKPMCRKCYRDKLNQATMLE
jgi:thymidine kinase